MAYFRSEAKTTERRQLEYATGTVIRHPSTRQVENKRWLCPHCAAIHNKRRFMSVSRKFICASCGKLYDYPTPGTVAYVAPTISDNIPIENPDWIA